MTSPSGISFATIRWRWLKNRRACLSYMHILPFCIRDLRRRPGTNVTGRLCLLKATGPEAPRSPVLTLIIRRVLIDYFTLLMGNQGHVCHPHRSDLDNLRTHQQSSVKAPCGGGSAEGKHFQKREGHCIPASWSGRRNQVPG